MSKVYNLFMKVRCIKMGLSYKDKKFNVYLIKDSPAKVIWNDKIVINDLFLRNLNKEEQIAILYHEEYHKKFIAFLKQIWYLIRYFFNLRKTKWQEEFDADKYSAKKVGKNNVLSFLKKAKKDYEKNIVKYNPKTHPSIEERIKRIEELESEAESKKGSIKLRMRRK